MCSLKHGQSTAEKKKKKKNMITTAAYNLFKLDKDPTTQIPKNQPESNPKTQSLKGWEEGREPRSQGGRETRGTGEDKEELRGDPNLNPTQTDKTSLRLLFSACGNA